ncbi:hypothetical protein [Pseudomonas citronellolis]|uniref:hypothetical protein n=1 Tax=Pseudomonas citronellolis TaxID=53408 RepID=UPI0011C1425D|nr:hypothetical protein [Pseudomonas citronellolis]
MNQTVEIKRLDSLIRGRNYEEALSVCNLLLEKESSLGDLDVLRKRSHVYSLIGDYQLAIDDRLELIFRATEQSDFFFASLYCIRINRLRDAYRIVNSGILELPVSVHAPFAGELIFLRGYILLKLGLYQEAQEACGHIKDGMNMWVSNLNKPISKDDLKDAAEQRNSEFDLGC